MSWMDAETFEPYWFWLNIKNLTLEGFIINDPSVVWESVALVEYYNIKNVSYWCYETGEVSNF